MEHVISATLELNDKFTSRIQKSEIALKKFENSNRAITTSFKNGFDRATTGIDNFTEKFIQNRSKFASAGNKIVAGATAGALGVGAFVKKSFDKYADLEEILARNGALTGANIEQQKKLAEQTRQLGRDTRYSAVQVAEAQQYQAMAGYKTNEILALTPKLLKFATATGSDLARSSDIITDNLDAFGLKLSEVNDLMDTMAATANNSNTNVMMLGEAYQYVATASKGFDNFKEVNVMLGIMANNGIKGAKAGRNLAGMYTRLANPTKEMRSAFKILGVNLYDQNKKFKGLRNIIAEAKPKLEQMTDEQRNLLITTIAGAEGLKVWNSIMNYSVEGTEKVTNAVYNSNGAIEKQNEIMNKTPKAKIDELKSSFEELQLAIGEGVAPVATEIMNDLKEKIKETTSSDTFNKDSMEDFFRSLKNNAEIAIGVLGALKFATFASTNPYIAGGLFAVTGGAMFGNWLFNESEWGQNYKNKTLERWNAAEEKKLHNWKQEKDYNRMTYEMDFGKEGLEKADDTIFKNTAFGAMNDNIGNPFERENLFKNDFNTPIQNKEQNININVNSNIDLKNQGLNDETIEKIARESSKQVEEKIISDLKTVSMRE